VPAVLSDARFAPYLVAAHGDADTAIELYTWNLDASAAFLVPLHWTETALRNAMHERLCAMTGQPDWWTSAPLDLGGQAKVREARTTLHRLGKDADNPNSVVAELTFGFWVSLLGRRYHRTLWVPGLARVFPRAKRADVHRDYQHVLVLRNRVMHYEPIHHRHLEADHTTLRRLIGQLSKDALAAVAAHDRVPEVLARRVRG
jgi:hypothetical protein